MFHAALPDAGESSRVGRLENNTRDSVFAAIQEPGQTSHRLRMPKVYF